LNARPAPVAPENVPVVGRPFGMSDVPKVFLKRGREYAVRKGHPWVYSGAIARVEAG